MANTKNLKPGEYKFTHEDQVAGGIASGKARHEIATMKKTLKAMLKRKNENTDNTFEEDVTLGLILGAMSGKAENYKMIAQMTGELETTDKPVDNNWQPLADLLKVTPEEEQKSKEEE